MSIIHFSTPTGGSVQLLSRTIDATGTPSQVLQQWYNFGPDGRVSDVKLRDGDIYATNFFPGEWARTQGLDSSQWELQGLQVVAANWEAFQPAFGVWTNLGGQITWGIRNDSPQNQSGKIQFNIRRVGSTVIEAEALITFEADNG